MPKAELEFESEPIQAQHWIRRYEGIEVYSTFCTCFHSGNGVVVVDPHTSYDIMQKSWIPPGQNALHTNLTTKPDNQTWQPNLTLTFSLSAFLSNLLLNHICSCQSPPSFLHPSYLLHFACNILSSLPCSNSTLPLRLLDNQPANIHDSQLQLLDNVTYKLSFLC